MAGRTIWLEHEVSTIIVRWLARLSEWTAFHPDADDRICIDCVHYGAHLGLAGIPHALLHTLVTPLDDLVSSCFLVVATERYAPLLDSGWSIALVDGVVNVGMPAGWDETEAPEAADFRGELILLHTQLLGRAIRTAMQHHEAIATAVESTVDPVVFRLTSQLLEELSGH